MTKADITTFQSLVRDLSGRGTGVVDHPDGRVVFVPGVWPGDEGEFEVVSVQKRYALGRLVALTKASPHRVSPQCSHHGVDSGSCGGCPWMMADYASQVEFKEKHLRGLLQRSGLGVEALRELIPSQEVYGYRNRAQLKTDGEKLGYVSPVTHEIIDIKECPILTPHNRETLAGLRAQLPHPGWRPKSQDKWVSLNINEEIAASEVIPGKELGFLQGNSTQNEQMREWLRAQVSAHSMESSVLELFCGSGNFTEVLSAAGFQDILAFEGSTMSIEKLKAKGLPGVRAHTLNLYGQGALKQASKLIPEPKIMVLDPPRAGFKDLAQWVKTFKSLEAVYYISCDPMTFVRDAKSLVDRGAVLTEITPIDLFPHTPHIELMARFVLS